jgi:hypothetical protein
MDGKTGNIQLFVCNKLVVSASENLFQGDIFTVSYETQCYQQ